MKTKYTYKQIWTIAYPILISLIMEQLIGMGKMVPFYILLQFVHSNQTFNFSLYTKQ